MKSVRNILGVILLLFSIGMLIPGIFNTFFSIKAEIDLRAFIGKSFDIIDIEQSIVESVKNLIKADRVLVAFLILFFSIVVPLAKVLLLFTALFAKQLKKREKIHRFVKMIGKWSMADVFTVGILIAFLGVNAYGFIEASLHSGFYFFLAYCLCSIAGSQLIVLEK